MCAGCGAHAGTAISDCLAVGVIVTYTAVTTITVVNTRTMNTSAPTRCSARPK